MCGPNWSGGPSPYFGRFDVSPANKPFEWRFACKWPTLNSDSTLNDSLTIKLAVRLYDFPLGGVYTSILEDTYCLVIFQEVSRHSDPSGLAHNRYGRGDHNVTNNHLT